MSELTIATVLEYYGADTTRVRETGWRSIRCPFHEDRIASARVNLASGGFACLACGMRGDAIAIICRQEGLDFKDACEFAERIFGESVGSVRKTARKGNATKRRAWRDSLFD